MRFFGKMLNTIQAVFPAIFTIYRYAQILDVAYEHLKNFQHSTSRKSYFPFSMTCSCKYRENAKHTTPN